ncbi:MAG: hypothetical protein EOM90_06185 [Alphaproteobacteria bacterium]|nr:hypothetical protein [Alphaproteobacteria bacterium]
MNQARIFTILILSFVSYLARAQTTAETTGVISYITSQHVYVKFQSALPISAGDTLYTRKDQQLRPALVVKERSSVSCLCTPVPGFKPKVTDTIIYRPGQPKPDRVITAPADPLKTDPMKERDSIPLPGQAGTVYPSLPPDSANIKENKIQKSRQQIHGSLSVSSYANFSDSPADNNLRMKYTFALDARNIGNTNLSAEAYLSWIQNPKQWNEVPDNLFNNLKIYRFALKYQFGRSGSVLIGRKINPRMTNLGAHDGIQAEVKFRPFTVGILAGWRPDYATYGFNFNLFQFGGYIGHDYSGKNGVMQTTLAIMEQTNSWKTDRRFLYLQHFNSLLKNLTFNGTAEFDLFSQVYNEQDSVWQPSGTFRLTNLYLGLNYRIIKQLTVAFSYSSRQQVIFYETWKTELEKLTDPQATQGYLLQAMIRPARKLTIGLAGGYRFQKEDPRPSGNFTGYITYNRIPGILVDASASVTLLKTGYLGANIYGITMARDFANGIFSLGAGYKYVGYNYVYSDASLVQNIAEVNISWRIIKRLILTAYYEGTFEPDRRFQRIYAQLRVNF